MHLSPQVAEAAVCSKAVALLLLIHCLIFFSLDCGGSVFGQCFVRYYLVSFLVLQSY